MNFRRILVFILIFLTLFLFNCVTSFAGSPINIEYETDAAQPPLTFSQQGLLRGFEVDLINLIFNEENYHLNYSIDIWDNIYERMKRKQIDTCGILVITEERKHEMIFTEPVLQIHFAIYSRNSAPRITLANLHKYRVGVIRNYYAERILREDLKNKNYLTFASSEEGFLALAEGKIDAFLENQEVGNYFLVKKNLKHSVKVSQDNLFPVVAAYAVRKDNPSLVAYMNLRINQLKASGVYEEIYQKYFFSHSPYYYQHKKQVFLAVICLMASTVVMILFLLHSYIKYLKKKIFQANQLAQDERDFSQIIINNANIIILVWRVDGTLLKFNEYAQLLTGFSEEEVLGDKWRKDTILTEKLALQIPDIFTTFQHGGVPINRERALRCKDGRVRDVLWSNNLIFDQQNQPSLIISLGTDITDRQEAERKLQESYHQLEVMHEELAATNIELRQKIKELKDKELALNLSEERYRLALDAANDVVWDWDLQTNEFFCSSRIQELLGYHQDYFKSSESWNQIIHPQDLEGLQKVIRAHLNKETPYYQVEFRLCTILGGYKWVSCKAKAFRREGYQVARVIGCLTDISQQKEAAERIHKLAYYDQLTGLLNRVSFKEKLVQILEQSDQTSNLAGILFLDLDNFKAVNDTLGHSFGDEVLKEIALVLKECLEKNQLAARLGGDEFVILLPDCSDRNSIKRKAKEILSSICCLSTIRGQDFYCSASIGIAVYPQDGDNEEILLKNADTALYRAKELGKNIYQFYNEEMNAQILAKVALENQLRAASRNEEFLLFYQPQIDIETQQIVSMEALIRWPNPTRGFIPPDKFIPVAEEMGLIKEIGYFVLWKACRQNKKWQEAGYRPLRVAVNVSGKEIQEKDFLSNLEKVLEETNLDAQWLEIEITESAAIQDFDLTIKILQKLKEKGIRVSLDDFGTGYSSLNYLKRLPISQVKIDKSFVYEMTANSTEEQIAKAVIALAHSIELDVVAEGVENATQLALLKEYKCDKGQGYFFSKPLPPIAMEKLLTKEEIKEIYFKEK